MITLIDLYRRLHRDELMLIPGSIRPIDVMLV